MTSDWEEDVEGLKTLLLKRSSRYHKKVKEYIDYYAAKGRNRRAEFLIWFKTPLSKKKIHLNLFEFNERVDHLYFKLLTTDAILDILTSKIKAERKRVGLNQSYFFKRKHSYQFYANAEYIFYNLSSALGIIAHILNESYGMKLDEKTLNFTFCIRAFIRKFPDNDISKFYNDSEDDYIKYKEIRNYIAHHAIFPYTVSITKDLKIVPGYIHVKPRQKVKKISEQSIRQIETIANEFLNFCTDLWILLMFNLEQQIVDIK
jgi:hypothetical protein